MSSIVIAIPDLDRGGPDKVMSEVATGLLGRGWDVSVVVSSSTGYYLQNLPSEIRVHVLGRARLRLLGRYPVFALAREVRRSKPDIVMTTLRMNVTAGIGRRLWPRRTLLVMRVANHVSSSSKELAAGGLKYRLAASLDRRALRRATVIVAQSLSMADDLNDTLGPDAAVTVIGNPVGSTDRSTVRADRLPGEPALLAVGRLSVQKGFDVLIEALPAVVDRFPLAHLTILGDGPMRDSLSRSAHALGVSGRVSLLGQSTEVLSAMAGADLVVSPSRYEGFSNVIMEALLMGTPVVATTCPGAAQEVIRPGRDGLLVQPDDVTGLAHAICDVVGGVHRWDRAEISHNVQSNWSVDKIVDRYDDLLVRISATNVEAP